MPVPAVEARLLCQSVSLVQVRLPCQSWQWKLDNCVSHGSGSYRLLCTVSVSVVQVRL